MSHQVGIGRRVVAQVTAVLELDAAALPGGSGSRRGLGYLDRRSVRLEGQLVDLLDLLLDHDARRIYADVQEVTGRGYLLGQHVDHVRSLDVAVPRIEARVEVDGEIDVFSSAGGEEKS